MSTSPIDTWAECSVPINSANENVISRVGLLIAKGQYFEFAYTKLQQRYAQIPHIIQESTQVNAFARQNAHRELSLAAGHPRIKVFLTALKQASHHIAMLLQESDIEGAEEVLKLAEAKLQQVDHAVYEAHQALVAHEHVHNPVTFYRDQLLNVEADIYILEEMDAAIEERADNINPLLGGEFVTPYSHQLCDEEFGDGFDLEDQPTPFEALMDRIEKSIEYGKEVVDAYDLAAASRVVPYTEQLAREAMAYLMELDTAVAEFETANAMTPYSYQYFADEKRCSSPEPFDLTDHIGYAVHVHRMLASGQATGGAEAGGRTLKAPAARLIDTPFEEEDPLTAMDPECGSDLTYKDFDYFDEKLSAEGHYFDDDASDLSYKDFDLLDLELAAEVHVFETPAGLSYSDFELFDKTERPVVRLPVAGLNPMATPFTVGGAEAVIVSAPAKVFHPKPKAFAAVDAVKKWMSV